MFFQRLVLRKYLKMIFPDEKIKINFRRRAVNINMQKACKAFYIKSKEITAIVVIRKLNAQQITICLFYKDTAEDFVFRDDILIYHLVAQKKTNGPIDYGSFGRFIPIREETF